MLGDSLRHSAKSVPTWGMKAFLKRMDACIAKHKRGDVVPGAVDAEDVREDGLHLLDALERQQLCRELGIKRWSGIKKTALLVYIDAQVKLKNISAVAVAEAKDTARGVVKKKKKKKKKGNGEQKGGEVK